MQELYFALREDWGEAGAADFLDAVAENGIDNPADNL